jgi:hypothetical protein
MFRVCVCMHSRFIENHPICILEDGPLISEVVLSQAAPCSASDKIGDSIGYCHHWVLGLQAPGVMWSGILSYVGYAMGCGSVVHYWSGPSAFAGCAPR